MERGSRSFSLLKLTDGTNFGIAPICTWPELGEPTVESIVERIFHSKGFKDRRISALFDIAMWDYIGLELPPYRYNDSHQLVGSQNERSQILVDLQGKASGRVKLKMGLNLEWETQNWIDGHLRNPELVWRIDFNHYFKDIPSFLSWWNLLPKSIQFKIDFIEDPLPYDEVVWKNLKQMISARLAVDFCEGKTLVDKSFDVLIVKPVRDSMSWVVKQAEKNSCSVVVTSNLTGAMDLWVSRYYCHKLLSTMVKVEPSGLGQLGTDWDPREDLIPSHWGENEIDSKYEWQRVGSRDFEYRLDF